MVIKQKILVTGAGGQLGKELQAIASSFPQYDFIFPSKEELPVEDTEKVKSVCNKYHPQYLVNCAAYTAVDKAESQKELAFCVNAEAVGQLAAVCKENHTRFIHISTDYVFDGTGNTPYKEDAATNPQGVYGASKLEGEKLAMKMNPGSIIIRTSWVYSTYGKNFVKTMLKLMKEKEELNIVNDQIGSPTYAADLAAAICQVISSGIWEPGIYHYSNNGIISWHDFANAIKELTGSSCKLNPIPTSQYPTSAKRPAYSALDTSKIRQTYNIPVKNWKESLETCLQRF
jgi:dTDP-4-dehydrorhamnose reductase